MSDKSTAQPTTKPTTKVESLDTSAAKPAPKALAPEVATPTPKTPATPPPTPVDETKDLGQNQKPDMLVKDLDLSDKNNTNKSEKNDANSKDSMKMTKKQMTAVVILSLVAVAAGVGTGFGGYKLQARSGASSEDSPVAEQQVAGDIINNGDVFGVKDDQTFKDSAEGYLEKGGIDGEGSHKLLREGGISQTVYLTSSITDLDKLTGMQVKVWGETFKGQKAGWLMDVGRVQVIEMDVESPEIE